MSDPTSRYPEQQPQQPHQQGQPEQPPAYVPPPGYEEYAPRQQAPYAGGQEQPYQQPYQQGYPQPYQQGSPQRPTSVTAVIGLVLAFLVSPIGMIVSAFGIGDTRGGRKAGRGMAIAGVVVGAVGTVMWVLAIIAAVVFVQRSVETVTSLSSAIPSEFPTGLPSGLPSELPSGLPTDLGGALGGEDASADVTVESCSTSIGGLATGAVSVTNSGDDPASYFITLTALDADGQKVGDLVASIDGVAPGASAPGDAIGYVEGGGEIASCEVSGAVRSAAG
ncbi:hypothetical protein SAMN06264364_13037 [Quadrisphaera granulorum]|uniref:DUF4190 domain-containing protein n=1 Tax=Quadrisphaera granulorum TaxID=317664 RepID=A0A315ZTI1_9ACTN|nr:FxLYD domain-containing protein [Quadrisphaera granulorum]PWJ48473.1 hypothetical protein BXY45_13037 [Quadrisphaera granulorum]SZE98432.1 hypothetical protein SAMN06264364_13037 [Quadrisphaera granulorum]